jgi:hypothetical protein
MRTKVAASAAMAASTVVTVALVTAANGMVQDGTVEDGTTLTAVIGTRRGMAMIMTTVIGAMESASVGTERN